MISLSVFPVLPMILLTFSPSAQSSDRLHIPTRAALYEAFLPEELVGSLREDVEATANALVAVEHAEYDQLRAQLRPGLRLAFQYLGLFRLARLYNDDPLEWHYLSPSDDFVAVFPIEVEMRVGASGMEVFFGDKHDPKNYRKLREELKSAQKKLRKRYTDGHVRGKYDRVNAKFNFDHEIEFDPRRIDELGSYDRKWLYELGVTELLENYDVLDDSEDPLGLASVVDQKINELLSKYVPYEAAQVNIFKYRAYSSVDREFLTIFLDREFNGQEDWTPIAMGQVSTGSQTSPAGRIDWNGKNENTPDGKWEVFGFYSNYRNDRGRGDRMPGAIKLSYAGGESYVQRAFHGTCGYGYGSFGYPASHGCIRVYTNPRDQSGLADVLWASLNPGFLDHGDFQEGGYSWYNETPMKRFLIGKIRERTSITAYSSAFKKVPDSLYRQHASMEDVGGYSMKTLASFYRGVVAIKDPSSSKVRYGKYRVFDDKVRAHIFNTPVPKSRYYQY